MEAYTSATCTNDKYFDALDNFKQAREIYISAEDYEQVKNCDYILNRTNEALQVCMQQLMTSLDDSIREAETRAILAGENCSEYGSIMQFVKTTRDHAKSLSERFQMQIFNERAIQCDELLAKTSKAEKTCTQVRNLEKLYDQAYALYTAEEYEEALVLAQKAKEQEKLLCSGWGCEEWGPDRMDRLIENITRERSVPPGEPCSADYLKCLTDAERRKAECEAREDWGCVTKADRMIDIATTAIKAEADAYLTNASKYYEVRDFGTAKMNAEKSLSLYTRINDSEGTAKAKTFLDRAPEPPCCAPNLVPYIIAFILVAAAVILFLVRRRKKVA